MKKKNLLEILKHRALILDGAMGTNLQNQSLTPQDYGGKDGCHEYLLLSKPDAVAKVHADFLEAGCDAVETNTFGSNRIVLAEYGLEDKAYELSKKGAELAKTVATKYSTNHHPRFVIGSVGPGTKLPSLGHISFDELRLSYKEQISGLIDGGADAVLIETCQDLLQAKCAAISALVCFDEKRLSLPLMVQVTFETTGTLLLGTDPGAVLTALEMFPIDVLGINCATGPAQMADQVRHFCENTNRFVSVLPNAGMPENIGGRAHYRLSPEEFAAQTARFVTEFGVNIVGGCCGTTPEHLKALVKKLSGQSPKYRQPTTEPACSSLYTSTTYKQNPAPLLVGEQTNANGSKKFREILEKNDYDSLVQVARDAVREGAHMVDLCVAYAGRNEVRDMTEAASRFNQHITVPVMIDSTEVPVIETALKHIAGKAIINSVNLEDGEKKIREIAPLAKKYGAGLVALTIDEQGMAKTTAKKFEIAKRIHDLLTQEFEISPADIFFDTLTFTLASGDEEFKTAAVETLEAIRRIKEELPGANTLLGLSNISFGLAPHSRPVLNSVFLHEAVTAGLDAAIVHAKKIIPLFKIPEKEQQLAKALLYNQPDNELSPLQAYMAHFSKQVQTAVSESHGAASSIEEKLKHHILDGNKADLESTLAEALKKYQPLEIINQFLLEGMKDVGELFGAGKMQLPFVLQSAEVMKKAVTLLEPHMDKLASTHKGSIVLATVKGDVHDIGKNLVDIILTNNGFKVINLGIKQPVEAILKAAEEHRPDAIGLSGLLVKSTLIMKENLEEMNQRGIRLPVLCGGAALTRKYVEDDLSNTYQGNVYYGQDAFSGLKIMNEITQGKSAPAPTTGSQPKKLNLSPGIDSSKNHERSPKVALDVSVPAAPFYGIRQLSQILLADIFSWINKVSLYRAQWQFKRGSLSTQDYETLLQEKVEPLFRSLTHRVIEENMFDPKVVYGYYPCCSDKNDLIILKDDKKSELTRFHFPRQQREPFYCISDFFRPKSSGEFDVVAFQLVTIGPKATELTRKLYAENKYQDYLYLHGLSVETAEALAEYVHALIRKELGIHTSDSPDRDAIFRQCYQGSRYSFGYPACPNLEDHGKLFKILPADSIGVTLTEGYQLVPEQSTSAIIVHHPQAKYFSV